MPLPQLFNHKDTVQFTAMIKDIRKHVTAKFDALSCGCRCHLEEMLCSVISNSTCNQASRTTTAGSKTRTASPTGSNHPTTTTYGAASSSSLPNSKPIFPNAKTD
jgi:hypothetical protein